MPRQYPQNALVLRHLLGVSNHITCCVGGFHTKNTLTPMKRLPVDLHQGDSLDLDVVTDENE